MTVRSIIRNRKVKLALAIAMLVTVHPLGTRAGYTLTAVAVAAVAGYATKHTTDAGSKKLAKVVRIALLVALASLILPG